MPQTMKYYIDTESPANYIGGFNEGNPVIPAGAVEVSAPPPDYATQTTTDGGITWSVYPPA
jgi:hypothetical protein